MSDLDDDYDDGSCWQCGGEGFTFDCFDGACEDAEIGCDDCTRPCSICSPRKPDPVMQKVLGTALATTEREG